MENNNIKKNFIALVNACGTRDDILKMIENNMNLLLAYVCAVYNMETQLPILRFRLEGEDSGGAARTTRPSLAQLPFAV